MSRVCEGCGKRPTTGNNVSYSQRKTKRRFLPNLFTKRIWFAPKKIFLKIKMCTRCLRTLNKKI